MRALLPILLILALNVLHAPALLAQETPAAEAPNSPIIAPAAAPPDDAAPVQVPEPSELALQRYRSSNVLWFLNQFWGLLIPALFLFTGLSAKLRDHATRIGRRWFFIIAVYFVFYAVLNYIIDFPLAYYQGYIRDHAYGLSNQTFQKWFQDSLISLGVGLVIGVLVLWIPYLLLKKSPRRWWLYTALLIPPFLFFQMLINPVFIDPLFNDFQPMQDKALEADIFALAQQAGIEGSRIFEVNKSIDTNAVNAYVTGFMDTKRIVLWDTLLQKLNREEVLFVMAHEMGHYVLNHVNRFIAFISLVLLAALYLIHRISGALINRFRHRFRFSALSDIASLPLIILLMNLFSLVATPLILGMSRYHEHEADRFGIELTRDNRAAATGFVKLQQENLAVPWHGPLYTLWRSSHPSIGHRITFFNTYRPWKQNQPLRYEHHFKPPA